MMTVLKKGANSSLCGVYIVTKRIFINMMVKHPATVLIGAPNIPAEVLTKKYSSTIFTVAPAAIDTIGSDGFIYDCNTAFNKVVKQEKTIATDKRDNSGAANEQASASLGYIRSRIGFENTAIPAAAGIEKARQSFIEAENILVASSRS